MKISDIIVAKKLVNLEQSANNRNIPFDVSYKKMRQLLARQTCYYTGVKFNKKNIRSIDRVDNTKGYVDDNIVACTVSINSLKNNLTLKEIHQLNNRIKVFLDNHKKF